jgi:hypothetical protein
MRRLLLILFGVLTYNIISAQVTITTDTTSDKFKIQESTYITDMPLGSVYVDVNSSGNIGLKILGTDKLIVGYKTPATYTINGVLQSNKDTCVKYLSLATSLKLEYLISNISSGGGGSSYLAKNGIYIDSDTIKLGGNITEDTKLDNPTSKSFQIGSDGDAMNLNVVPPFPYNGLINSYSGYDYRSAEYMSFIGILKGLNFAPLGFSNQDMVGTFTIVGNPFDSIYPDGSIMIDGVWELGGQVAMNKLVFTFLGSDITFNTISMSEIENTEEIEGDNAFQFKSIVGDNGSQNQTIAGDNGNQTQQIIGDNGNQTQQIIGEDGKIERSIIDSVNNARAKEEITSTSYLFYGEKVVGSDTIFASNSISPNGFVREFKSGSLINKDTLNENMYKVEAGNITLKLDSAGLNYGTTYSPFNLSGGILKYEYDGVTDTLTLKSTFLKINPTFLGFYNKEPILQPILPLGSSTDDVIQVLQNLGLVRED